MKIALCLEYPIGIRGGVSVLVETLLREFAGRGHDLWLVSPDDSAGLHQSEIGNLIRGHFRWEPRPRRSASDAKDLARQLAGAGVNLVHFHLGGNYGWENRFPFHCPVYFLDRLGIPCITSVHLVVSILDGYCGAQKPVWFKTLMLPLAWWGKIHQLRHVRREIAVSRHDLRKLQAWYWPWRNRYAQIYHSRLSQGPFPPTSIKRNPVILNVGQIAWRKGQAVLAEAFARVAPRYPDWILQLAGQDTDGVTTQQILRITREHGLDRRILLLGERNDALDLMQHAAIYVQPSFWEALGLALQEAMSCGCACIGSRAGGIPELISDDRLGLLVEPGNVSQLSQALEQLMRDESRRETLGRAAATAINERGMTVEAMVMRHLELYESIITGY
jgi:glycosyltransferase involved in cell wall biosynthesis